MYEFGYFGILYLKPPSNWMFSNTNEINTESLFKTIDDVDTPGIVMFFAEVPLPHDVVKTPIDNNIVNKRTFDFLNAFIIFISK